MPGPRVAHQASRRKDTRLGGPRHRKAGWGAVCGAAQRSVFAARQVCFDWCSLGEWWLPSKQKPSIRAFKPHDQQCSRRMHPCCDVPMQCVSLHRLAHRAAAGRLYTTQAAALKRGGCVHQTPTPHPTGSRLLPPATLPQTHQSLKMQHVTLGQLDGLNPELKEKQ